MGKKTGPKPTSPSLHKRLEQLDKASDKGGRIKNIPASEKAELLKLNKKFLEFRKEYRDDTLETIEADSELSKRAQLTRLSMLKSKLYDQLTHTQLEFIKHYLMDHDLRRAALMSGLNKGYAVGSLMSLPTVRDYIKVCTRINELTTGITQEFVIAEFLKLAKVNVQDLYDKNGRLLPVKDIKPEVAAAISEIKVRSWMENEVMQEEVTYKLHSKLVALDALAKHVGLYEKDNRQKATVVLPQFILPHNGRNADLLENNNIPITPHTDENSK